MNANAAQKIDAVQRSVRTRAMPLTAIAAMTKPHIVAAASDIGDIVKTFPSISLDETNRLARMMSRTDNKYHVTEAQFVRFVEAMKGEFAVLKIDADIATSQVELATAELHRSDLLLQSLQDEGIFSEDGGSNYWAKAVAIIHTESLYESISAWLVANTSTPGWGGLQLNAQAAESPSMRARL